jgi:hypothetical protein
MFGPLCKLYTIKWIKFTFKNHTYIFIKHLYKAKCVLGFRYVNLCYYRCFNVVINVTRKRIQLLLGTSVLGGPIFKESSQNFPPDPYISLYTWKTAACKFFKHFDNFWTHLSLLKICKNCHFSSKCPFSSIYLNLFLSKMRKNSVFLMIFRRLAIILAFTTLWAMKNEEMVNVQRLKSIFRVF